MADANEPERGEIVIASERFTLQEFCDVCGLPRELVVELVENGIVDPEKGAAEVESWSFSVFALHRARRALRLRRDLEVNLAGLSLSLDLLDEVERLRGRVRRLEQELRVLVR